MKKLLVLVILCLPILSFAFSFPKSLGPVHQMSYKVVFYHGEHFFIQYPVFSLPNKKSEKVLNDAIQKIINSMFNNITDAMLNAMKEFPSSFSRDVDYKLTFKITFWGERYLSILFSDNAFLCGAHANGEDKTLNFDMKRGKILKLSDLFTTGTDYVSELSKIVRQSALSTVGYNFFKSIKKSQDFLFLSNDTLVLVFQEYEYTPYSAARPKIYVQLDHLKGFKLKLQGMITDLML